MTNRQLWRLALVLFAVGSVGILTLLTIDMPYPEEIKDVVRELFSPLQLRFLSMLNPTIYLLIAVSIGVLTYRKGGYQLPVFENAVRVNRQPVYWGKILKNGILSGLVCGLALVGLFFMFKAHIPEELNGFSVNWLNRFFYGGITEEILIRFGVMSFFTWLFLLFTKKKTPTVYWLALSISSFLFALAHLPVLYLIESSPAVWKILYLLLGNTLCGILYGYQYWKNNLETAMIAHIFTHVILLIADAVLPM